MEDVGKLLIFSGLIMLIIGIVLYFVGKEGLPLGHMPGDIVIRKKNMVFFFPIVSMLILSVILTVVVNLLGRWFR